MTVVEEITTRVANLPEEGQREVLDFVEFLSQRQCSTSLKPMSWNEIEQAAAEVRSEVFAERSSQCQRSSTLRERGRELARRARLRNAGTPQGVVDQEIEQAIAEVRQRAQP